METTYTFLKRMIILQEELNREHPNIEIVKDKLRKLKKEIEVNKREKKRVDLEIKYSKRHPSRSKNHNNSTHERKKK